MDKRTNVCRAAQTRSTVLILLALLVVLSYASSETGLVDDASSLQRRNPHASFSKSATSGPEAWWASVLLRPRNGFVEAAENASWWTPPTNVGQPVASAIDWRKRGAVTAVKRQGVHCDACWAFSTTGNIEGQWAAIGRHPLVSLSEQQLVSCDGTNDACRGGWMGAAMRWLLATDRGAMATEASYPYWSILDGWVPPCNTSNRVFGAQIVGYERVQRADIAEFVSQRGPLAVGVDARPWTTYKGGVLTECPSGVITHAALLVGFNRTADPPYWLLKNSWGTQWGEDGYIRLGMQNVSSRGSVDGPQPCNLGEYQVSAMVTPNGPTPPPGAPLPTPEPTATPSPRVSVVEQLCSSSRCSLGSCASAFVYPNATCTPTAGSGGDGSALAICNSTFATIQLFESSSDCAGEPTQIRVLDVDRCLPRESSGVLVLCRVG